MAITRNPATGGVHVVLKRRKVNVCKCKVCQPYCVTDPQCCFLPANCVSALCNCPVPDVACANVFRLDFLTGPAEFLGRFNAFHSLNAGGPQYCFSAGPTPTNLCACYSAGTSVAHGSYPGVPTDPTVSRFWVTVSGTPPYPCGVFGGLDWSPGGTFSSTNLLGWYFPTGGPPWYVQPETPQSASCSPFRYIVVFGDALGGASEVVALSPGPCAGGAPISLGEFYPVGAAPASASRTAGGVMVAGRNQNPAPTVTATRPPAARRPLPCVHLGRMARRAGCSNCPRDDLRRCDAGHGEVTQNGFCETCPDYEADA